MVDAALPENASAGATQSLQGKLAIVTGATSGIGFETAVGLARRGAETILASRNPDKGAQALSRLLHAVPGAKARFERLDLASLASVARFAETITAGATPPGATPPGAMTAGATQPSLTQPSLMQPGATNAGVVDILVNNAGVMGSPTRRQTQDGFEQQFGVNYLAHFALTARLKDALCAAPGGGRVVGVASLSHRRGRLQLDDLQSERSYDPMRVYAQSKLAMLIFAIELQRRAAQNRWSLRSVAAHPGWARTEIINSGIGEGAPGLKAMLIDRAFAFVAQSAHDGALPSLYAATAPDAKGGGYYGPSGLGETRGAVGVAKIFPQAADPEAGRRLWMLSEKLTGVTFS